MKKLLALFATAILALNVQAGEYPDISITDLDKAIKAGKVVVIDVNGAKSFTKRGRIPGACAEGGVRETSAAARSAWLGGVDAALGAHSEVRDRVSAVGNEPSELIGVGPMFF